MDEEKLNAYIAHLRVYPEDLLEYFIPKPSKFQKWYFRMMILAKDKLKMPIDWRF